MTKILPLDDLPRFASLPGDNELARATEFEDFAGAVITVGNFDGVHQGHASLLNQVRAIADRRQVPAVAVVLDPHPVTILRPDIQHKRLTWIERRAELMSQHGIDALVVCKTSSEFLRLTAEEFFNALVIRCFQASGMVEGPNFFFGRDRGGDLDVLGRLCRQHQIELTVVAPTATDGEMVSSTRIRRLLEIGEVEAAAAMLGSNYRIRGSVTTGAKRGREIGFPTANLTDIDVVVPAPGVYGGFVPIPGRSNACLGAIHIGPNPTFEQDGDSKVEIHLLDYDGDLYDQVLLVDFVCRVRDIARFDSSDDLIQQLHQDINSIRKQLA